MDYQRAADIRKKGLANLITENILEGKSIGSSFGEGISDRTKATFTGIKEKFDPVNIVKSLTGGSKLASAIFGRLTGRDQSTLKYFAGKKKRVSAKGYNFETGEAIEDNRVQDLLGMIYEELKLAEEDRKLLEKNKEEDDAEQRKLEDDRNNAIIEALTGRKIPAETVREKAKRKKEEVAKKKKAKRKEQESQKQDKKQQTDTKKDKQQTKTEQTKDKAQAETKEKKTETAKRVEEVKPEVKPKVEKVPEVKPEVKPEIKPTPTVKPQRVPTKPPTVAKIPPVVTGGTKALVLSALVAAGYSKQAQANVLANVEKESNFKPRSEELEKYSAKTLYKLYGPPGAEGGQPAGGKNRVRFQTLQDAQAVVSQGPVAVGDVIYAGRMGNDKPGDGYKYRGRGFIQITGKENYEKIGKAIGVDLVNNPDLANDPAIAAKIIPVYFKMKIKKAEDLEDIDKVNRAVGSASEQSKEERKTLAAAYVAELNVSSQIEQASKENKELRKETKTDKPAPIINNTSINQVNNTIAQKDKEKVDDSPAPIKKSRGM